MAAGLARFGQRVLLLEHHAVGGDCTNVGCIPSKSLLHLAAHPSDATETPAMPAAMTDAINVIAHDTTAAAPADDLDDTATTHGEHHTSGTPGLLPDVAAVATAALTAAGIDLRPGLVAHRWDDEVNGVVIGPMDGEEVETLLDVDAILMAVGRTPNVHGLGLTGANLQLTDDGRVQVDDRGRTNVEGVWAVGDLATTGGTTHAADSWGRRVVQSIVFPLVPAGKTPVHPAVVFTSPEIATIGTLPTTPPDDVHRFTIDLASLDRAYTDEVTNATMVVDVRRLSGRITGAAIVGPRAGELVSTVALLMHADVGLHRLVHMVMPYPTWSQAFRALEDQWMATALPQMHTDARRWASARFATLRDKITGTTVAALTS